jgi:PI-3-kinase-related kinase SMG-1
LHAGTIAATYVLLVQHASDQVSSEATRCLTQELESLKEILLKDRKHPKRAFSDSDIYSLFKFDLMVLLGSVFLKQTNAAGVSQSDKKMLVPDIIERVEPTVSKVMQLKRFILTKLNPFQDPLQWHPNLQLGLLQALRKLGPNISINDAYMCKVPGEGHTEIDCNLIISHALQARASLPVKLEALEWISSSVEDDSQVQVHKRRGETGQGSGLGSDLLMMLLSAGSNQEPQVRAHVASVLELLLQAKMVKPLQFQSIAMVALEQLGDSEPTVQAAFQRVFWAYSPAALWTHGWFGNAKAGESHGITECTAGDCRQWHLLHWKQAFAVKRFAQHLRVQQLVWILNYLSQRGQTLPSNWLQRLIHNCPGKSRSASTWRAPGEGEKQEPGMSDDKVSSVGEECTCGETAVLEAACVVNNVAAAWWAVQEASRHCITVRLRTHLGGPTQTFAALERMLLDVPQICQTDGGQRDGVGSSTASSSSSFQLLPMRLLLEFVESLKKNMYNAYEGSAVLPSAPSSSTLFFRSNRKVLI